VSFVDNSRRAFTLIEVLTVIAIILILMGLFFGGWKKWSATQARQLTVSRLEMLNGLLAEMEEEGHNQFQAQWFIPSTVYLDASQFGNISRTDLNSQPSTPTPDIVMSTVSPAPGGSAYCSFPNVLSYMATGAAPTTTSLVDLYSGTTPYTPQYGIMTKLMTLPDAAKEIAGLPSSAVISTAGPTSAGLSPTSNAVVVLDGWGNPILFVPAGGLINVYTNTNTASWPGPSTFASPIRSPDGRPFWVSAGPDGDLMRGDDNIYSFDLH
jgi:prepilin-type N-terminal cleavage/methylation domain-containing protein